MGFTCTSLVTKAGALQCSPSDTITKKELIESARKVSEKVRQQSVISLLFHQSRRRLDFSSRTSAQMCGWGPFLVLVICGFTGTIFTLVFLQVSHVLASLQAGNRGTQACITAASAVSGIIADLDTTIMFATAGTLNRENAETFADHR